MTIDVFKKMSVAAVALMMTAGVAQAQEVGEWDADASGTIEQEEFNTGFGETGAFGEWDANDDEGIAEDEFGTGIGEHEGLGEEEYAEWDANQDQALDENEFNEGVYSAYDEDESGDWNEEEGAAFEDDGWL